MPLKAGMRQTIQPLYTAAIGSTLHSDTLVNPIRGVYLAISQALYE